MLSQDSEDEIRSRILIQDLCLNLQTDFGKMNSTLGSVVPLAMFVISPETAQLNCPFGRLWVLRMTTSNPPTPTPPPISKGICHVIVLCLAILTLRSVHPDPVVDSQEENGRAARDRGLGVGGLFEVHAGNGPLFTLPFCHGSLAYL